MRRKLRRILGEPKTYTDEEEEAKTYMDEEDEEEAKTYPT
jgi:hypothetical protein